MNMEMTLVSDFVTFSFDRGLAKLTPIVFLLQFGHQNKFYLLINTLPNGATFYLLTGKFVYKDVYYSEEAQIQNDFLNA